MGLIQHGYQVVVFYMARLAYLITVINAIQFPIVMLVYQSMDPSTNTPEQVTVWFRCVCYLIRLYMQAGSLI